MENLKQLVTLTTTVEEQQKIIASQTDIIRQIHTKLTVTVTGAEECQCMAWVYKLVQSPPSRTQALRSWRIQSRWGVP